MELIVVKVHSARLRSRRVLITGEDAELAIRLGSAFRSAGAILEQDPVHSPSGSDGSGLARAAVRELGGLDVLVNIGPPSIPGDGQPSRRRQRDVERALRRSMALLVTTTEAALPSMKAGASIINTAALSARHLTPGQDALAAAVADTTQGWAEILSSRGIRANAVVGGPLLDPNVDADLADPDGAAPRGCEAELDAFVYLASQESSHVSGSVVSVSRSFADPGTEAGFEGKEVPDKDR